MPGVIGTSLTIGSAKETYPGGTITYCITSKSLRSYEVRENPYFSFYHGEYGNLTVESKYQDCGLKMFFRSFSKPYSELGYKKLKDLNAHFGDGLFYMQCTTRCLRKCSTAKAFIKPAQFRNNLKISKYSFVKEILFNKHKGSGVKFEKNGVDVIIRARKEVIVSAGAISSPQLLMLSGVGPRDHLEELGKQVVSNLKVGYNLQHHYVIRGVFASLGVDILKPSDNEAILKLVFQSKGIAEINGRINAVGYLKTSRSTYPNIIYFFSAYATNSTYAVNRDNDACGFAQSNLQMDFANSM